MKNHIRDLEKEVLLANECFQLQIIEHWILQKADLSQRNFTSTKCFYNPTAKLYTHETVQQNNHA